MKKVIITTAVCFLCLFAKQTQAQCDVNGTAFPYLLCGGDQLSLFSNGTCGTIMFDDFNSGGLAPIWSSINANLLFTNPCPSPAPSPGPNGFYLWIDVMTTTSHDRSIVTHPIDVSSVGCKVEFWMRYGIDTLLGNCESPDQPFEGVYLEYSTNGTIWTTFPGPNLDPIGNLSLTPPFTTISSGTGGYWQPIDSLTGQQQSTLYFWNHYESNIPAAANTTNTQFRWIQKDNSYTGYDVWGIDEVRISCPQATSNYAWITPESGDTVFYVQNPPMFTVNFPNNPSTITGGQYDTCWFVTIWDSLGYSATDTVCVAVIPNVITNFNTTVNNFDVQFNNLSQNAISYYWDFGDGNTSTLENPSHTYAAPGTYYVSLNASNSCDGDQYFDTIHITGSGVKEIMQTNLYIYPNPAKNNIHISFDSEKDVKYQIEFINSLGQSLFLREIDGTGSNLVHTENIESFAKGIYYISIKSNHFNIQKSILIE